MKIKAILQVSLCFVSFLLISSPGVAQVSEKEKQEKEAERKQQLEHKTYVLVDDGEIPH